MRSELRLRNMKLQSVGAAATESALRSYSAKMQNICSRLSSGSRSFSTPLGSLQTASRNAQCRSLSSFGATATFRHALRQSNARPGALPRSPKARIPTPSARHASNTFFGRLMALRKTNPVALPAALISMTLACGTLLAVTWVYMAYFVPIDTTFPEPVAKKLKRALYYTNQEVNPSKAWDYYKQALQAAEEAQLHPFSDEVLGIKFTAAGMLQRTNHVREAAQLLDVLRADCLRFVEWCEGQHGPADVKRARTRVLGKTVGICVKLGELYSDQYVRDLPAAERSLTQGVELALKEQQRRAAMEVKDEEEGEWLSREELGGTLEALADHHEATGNFTLASPLYLRAVTLAQPPSCHTAILMNNLATSLFHTLPSGAIVNVRSDSATPPPTSRTALVSNARSWAEKALEVGRSVQLPERSEECDIACAVAMHNLGEFAELEGLVDEARRRYEEAKSLALKLKFEEGVDNADTGLARLGRRGDGESS